MSSDRRQRLDALDFVWDPLVARWEEGFRFLEIYRQREGHCRASQLHREQGFRLGHWVNCVRRTKDTMPLDCRQQLDALGFEWGLRAASWEDGFRFLERYRQREGHCRVPQRYCDPVSGYRLGTWVNMQRSTRDAMSPERRQRLEALGFVWDPFEVQWEEGCRSLAIFRQREGHCRVPKSHHEQGFRLGQWVGVQRSTRDAMSPERRQRLDALGFVWKVH